ncbi:MAG: single-stranded DNA-binding protein [Bacteroidales bacterium]|nr:single-stranded DNA-binding protein [Bacteroidales bacterium]
MNQVILIGFGGHDPKSFSFEGGKNKTTFSMATPEHRRENSLTTWHNVVTWNGLAKIATEYLKKSSHVAVTGKISYRSFEKDGQKQSVTKIVAEKFSMLDRAPAAENSR